MAFQSSSNCLFGNGHPRFSACARTSPAADFQFRRSAEFFTSPPLRGLTDGVAPLRAQSTTEPRVAILMCVLDGSRFLRDQLTSIAAQSHSSWRLIVSDDGSRDTTCDMIERFADAQDDRSQVELRDGPRRGPTANFLSLACDPTIDADYFAYCDQDDIWASDKLKRSIDWLQAVPGDVPALYCSRTRLVAEDGRPYGHSPLFSLAPSFHNALVQNLGGGNTMVFNRAARDLLVRAAGLDVVAHDWWTYMLVIGAGGRVFYDPEASVDYRQHGQNQVGANAGLVPSLKRLFMVANGRFSRWNVTNTHALEQCMEMLTPDNRLVLRAFIDARTRSTGLKRLRTLKATGLCRQTRRGQLALLTAAFLGRI